VQQLLQVVPGQLAQLQQLVQLVPQQIQQPSQVLQPLGQSSGLSGFAAAAPWGTAPPVFGQPGLVM
jgi:Tfp pilus assembly PilM family ATPase